MFDKVFTHIWKIIRCHYHFFVVANKTYIFIFVDNTTEAVGHHVTVLLSNGLLSTLCADADFRSTSWL